MGVQRRESARQMPFNFFSRNGKMKIGGKFSRKFMHSSILLEKWDGLSENDFRWKLSPYAMNERRERKKISSAEWLHAGLKFPI